MAQSEVAEGPWLTLGEAAQRSGVHKEALRARAKRGHLPHRRGNSGQVLVQLPRELLDVAQVAAQGDAQASAHAQVEQLVDVVRDLEQEMGELKERLARTEAERDAARVVAEAETKLLREVLEREQARADGLAAELREHRRPWWRRWSGR